MKCCRLWSVVMGGEIFVVVICVACCSKIQMTTVVLSWAQCYDGLVRDLTLPRRNSGVCALCTASPSVMQQR